MSFTADCINDYRTCNLAKIPDLSCDANYSIVRLPSTLPLSMAAESLVATYGFTPSDFTMIWAATKFSVTNGSVLFAGLEEVAGVLCEDPAPGSNASLANGGTYTHVSIYGSMLAKYINRWIVASENLCCGADCLAAPALPGPAPAPMKIDPILPTPTFVPRTANSCPKIDESMSDILRADRCDISVNPPAGRCIEDESENEDSYSEYSWTETRYDALRAKMVWVPSDTIWCRMDVALPKHTLVQVSSYSSDKNVDMYEATLPDERPRYHSDKMLGVIVCEAEDLEDEEEFPNISNLPESTQASLYGYRVLVKVAGKVYIRCPNEPETDATYGLIHANGTVWLRRNPPGAQELYFESPGWLSHKCTDNKHILAIETMLPASVCVPQAQMVKIVKVPEIGFGAGVAKAILGFDERGNPILDETETPVMIPKLS